MTAVLSQRTLSYETMERQEFLPEVELIGKKYTDVFSNDVSNFTDPKPYKYYCNTAAGLIGFVDSSGVLWRLTD